MMMSAQTVLDSVNKYRHGVLVGNFVEDKFGKDLSDKGAQPDAQKLPTTKDHHDLTHSLYQPHEQILGAQKSKSHFYSTAKEVNGDQYRHPEKESTYNIFYLQQMNRKVPVLENNAKREERLNNEGRLYDQTRNQLANKFISNRNPVQGENIPDILTGEIFQRRAEPGESKEGQASTNIGNKIAAKTISPFGTYNLVRPQIQKFEEVEYNKLVYPNQKGEHRDILFGHGIALQEFQRRQLATTYDLSFNQQIKPQTQIYSFFQPDHFQTAKQFHRETVHEKNHQPLIPPYGDRKILSQPKAGRPYDPYTKTFDSNHLKHQYLRK